MSNKFHDWRKNNPEKRSEQKRREKIRIALRKRGILPPVGEEMNEEQRKINDEISNNDFSFWESIKNKPYNDGGVEKRKSKNKTEEYYLWKKTKKYCTENNFIFDLKLEDIVIPESCPYLNIFLTTDLEFENSDNFYCLDRIDYNKGFFKKNIIIVSKLAFDMKKMCSNEILLLFADKLLKIHSKSKSTNSDRS